MWFDDLPVLSTALLGSLKPKTVLYDYEGPKIFTSEDVSGSLLLCYQCEEEHDEKIARFLVVPTSDLIIGRLTSGAWTVHDALNQPWLWLIEVVDEERIHRAWKVDGLDSVPQRAKPKPDVMLWLNLMPLLAYRLIGEGLSEGKVPASVMSAALNRPTIAVKRLLQIVGNRVSQTGRPDNAFRELYDLNASRLAYRSFEVSFQPIKSEQSHLLADELAVYDVGADTLAVALAWLEGASEDLDISLLEVLDALTPPMHGQITQAEVKGKLVKKSMLLTREHTKRVRKAIARLKVSPELLTTRGRVRELDRDKRTFILRDRADDADLNCSFDEALYDNVFDAFDGEFEVNVQGRLSQNRRIFEIGAIEQAVVTSPVERADEI